MDKTLEVKKIRFVEPGNLPYRVSLKNIYTYEKYIRTPSTGLMTLTTIVKRHIEDTLMYSESISLVKWNDVFSADIVFIGIFTFNASRGYEIAKYIKQNSNALVVMGGLHASLNYTETVQHCDYVLLGEGDESILDFIFALQNKSPLNFPGIAYKEGDKIISTGERKPPEDIDVIPNRYLLYNYHKMAGHNTIWLQVHASRGCPHTCDYCSVVRHFGRKVRMRSPENIVEDIRQSIAFHDRKPIRRICNFLWITDDNFFADRTWAVSVLNRIIESGIKFKFSVQARYEVGFDYEILELMKKAGFFEIAMGIEFIDDVSFDDYHKKCTYDELLKSIKNIQKHGLNVRGLFIFGADNDKIGVGKKLANFVIENNIRGVLLQSMYFVPGTPVYDVYKDKLIHQDWSKYNGHVVHYPKNISPYELQKEIISASKTIYSYRRLFNAIFFEKALYKLFFIGEFFWQRSVCRELKKELPMLKELKHVMIIKQGKDY